MVRVAACVSEIRNGGAGSSPRIAAVMPPIDDCWRRQHAARVRPRGKRRARHAGDAQTSIRRHP